MVDISSIIEGTVKFRDGKKVIIIYLLIKFFHFNHFCKIFKCVVQQQRQLWVGGSWLDFYTMRDGLTS